MKPELPSISIKFMPNINIESIIEKNQADVSVINEEYKAIKGTSASRVTKSISFTAHELDVINSFLKENNMTIGDFIKIALFNDGAFNESFLAATAIQKKMDISFTKINPGTWTYNYKNNFDNFEIQLSQDIAYNHSKRKPKSIFFTMPMECRIQTHIDAKGFPSFSSFVKKALIAYKVYSEALGNVVLSGIHATKGQSKSKKVDVDKRSAMAKPISASLNPREYLLYTKYNDAAKERYDITLALVIKFMLIEKSIITNTLQQKNSPKNKEKKSKFDLFTKDLFNNKVPVDFTGGELTILTENIGNKKNVSISFNDSNFYELTDYMKKNNITFSKLISDYLHLSNISRAKEYKN
jgi:hypothetical protein